MIVEWLGPNDRMIPNAGVANTGDKINMPDDIALSLIAQGLACHPKPKKQPVEDIDNGSLRSKE